MCWASVNVCPAPWTAAERALTHESIEATAVHAERPAHQVSFATTAPARSLVPLTRPLFVVVVVSTPKPMSITAVGAEPSVQAVVCVPTEHASVRAISTCAPDNVWICRPADFTVERVVAHVLLDRFVLLESASSPAPAVPPLYVAVVVSIRRRTTTTVEAAAKSVLAVLFVTKEPVSARPTSCCAVEHASIPKPTEATVVHVEPFVLPVSGVRAASV